MVRGCTIHITHTADSSVGIRIGTGFESVSSDDFCDGARRYTGVKLDGAFGCTGDTVNHVGGLVEDAFSMGVVGSVVVLINCGGIGGGLGGGP